jgi:2-methylisocitrate lyase-like PEP mutase family enzyme
MSRNDIPDDVRAVTRLGAGATDGRAALRTIVDERRTVVVPGITDAMGALLAQQAGFEVAYATGAGLANVQHGVPDIGLISATDLVDHVGRLAAAASIPLIVDADTGFGGPLAVIRTVKALERVGAAGIQLEDQEMPKKCGHFDSHSVIPAEHMQAKIAAAIETRQDPSLVIMARTDARSAHGLKEAIARGKAYGEAGADAVFIEAPVGLAELEAIGRELAGIPLVVNVVEGGKTPQLTLAEYEKLGFSIVLHANFLMRAMMKAGQLALAHLRANGETAGYVEKIATWEERQRLFRLPEFTATAEFYDRAGQPITERSW